MAEAAQAPTPQAPSEAAPQQEQPQAQPRKIAPIPPVLPGLRQWDTPEQDAEIFGGAEVKKAGKARRVEAPPAQKPEAEEAAPAEEQEQPQAEEQEADDTDDGQPVVFAGQEFKSLKQAEDAFKAAMGRTRRLQQQEPYFQQIAAQNEQLNQRLAMLESYIAQAAQGQPQQDQEEPAPVDAKSAWIAHAKANGTFQSYREIADERGPEVAAAWLSQQQFEFLNDFFGSQLSQVRDYLEEQAIRPRQEEQRQAQAATVVTTFWQRQAQLADSEGNPIYPEISYANPDLNAVRGISEFMFRLPPEVALTDDGFRMAVLAYRDFAARTAGGGSNAEKVTAALLRQRASSAQAGAVSAQSGAAVRPPARGKLSEADSIVQQMSAAKSRHPGLGFQVRPELQDLKL